MCIKRLNDFSASFASLKKEEDIHNGIRKMCKSFTDKADKRFVRHTRDNGGRMAGGRRGSVSGHREDVRGTSLSDAGSVLTAADFEPPTAAGLHRDCRR